MWLHHGWRRTVKIVLDKPCFSIYCDVKDRLGIREVMMQDARRLFWEHEWYQLYRMMKDTLMHQRYSCWNLAGRVEPEYGGKYPLFVLISMCV